ncbi:hypothetical protein VKT23_001253 [Stygiomarasmius scandens]|uniref:Uncharacterized protein n=1 Tax=Marasmiellus scandens TaxID=2682957 RepID=A0ABR1K6W3_9AGAR
MCLAILHLEIVYIVKTWVGSHPLGILCTKIRTNDREELFAVVVHKPDQLKIITEITEPSIFEILKNPGKRCLDASSEWQVLGSQDRAQARLKSGGLVDLAVHVTGENPEFTVNYTSPEELDILALAKESAPPSNLGLLVPMGMPRVSSFLKSSFLSASDPFELIQNTYDDNVKQVYLPIPDSSRLANSIRTLHYILLPCVIIFVAFGFQGTRIWMDSTMFDLNFWSWQKVMKAKELILTSYLDGGSRAKARLECQVLKSHFLPWGGYKLTVSVEQRDHLQRGMHVLHLEVSDGNRKRYSEKSRKSAKSTLTSQIKAWQLGRPSPSANPDCILSNLT